MSKTASSAASVEHIVSAARWEARLDLSPSERVKMERSVRTLSRHLDDGLRVYGTTQGFGPLVDYEADASPTAQGQGLISHLAAGQGEPLSPEATRLMFWLRLQSIKRGYSAVEPERWSRLAELWNRGFTPVVPRDGSLSASGDLVPLAHAALAVAGVGEAWSWSDNCWLQVPAKESLSALGVEAMVWGSREALAFVNGTSAALSVTCLNHSSIRILARALAALSGRTAQLLGMNREPYAREVALARGQQGQARVAEWIRMELGPRHHKAEDRPLQEPYSARCAPQVVGAVLDQLDSHEPVLVREASGCTDNPLLYEGEVYHGGNFHALPVALCSDQHALCVHQLAFLAERQLALLLDPVHNGGKPPMLTPRPGRGSGLAGVQLAATSFVSKIRQLAYPATLTALPTNLGNQDHVPMALNGANAVAEMIELAWLAVGALAIATNQWTHVDSAVADADTIWGKLQDRFVPLQADRPLAAEVRQAADIMEAAFVGATTYGPRTS